MEKWDNGDKKVVVIYPNSSDTSTYLREFYYENGILGTKGMYVNGKQEGLWEWWYSNGNKMDEANLTEGQYYGSRKHWYENGNPKLFEEIFDTIPPNVDCPSGKYIHYHENGKLNQIYTVINGKNEGKGIIYDTTNGSEVHLNFSNGLRHGEYFELHSNKKFMVKGSYNKGEQIGEWVWYDSTGKITTKEKY